MISLKTVAAAVAEAARAADLHEANGGGSYPPTAPASQHSSVSSSSASSNPDRVFTPPQPDQQMISSPHRCDHNNPNHAAATTTTATPSIPAPSTSTSASATTAAIATNLATFRPSRDRMDSTASPAQANAAESQLMLLSRVAEAAGAAGAAGPCVASAGRKRTADGLVKELDESGSASPPAPAPVRKLPPLASGGGHSRNLSTVSVASTARSTTVAELSSELRARLSYAMVKVTHGWQNHPIERVESLASQTVSPVSRHGSAGSPDATSTARPSPVAGGARTFSVSSLPLPLPDSQSSPPPPGLAPAPVLAPSAPIQPLLASLLDDGPSRPDLKAFLAPARSPHTPAQSLSPPGAGLGNLSLGRAEFREPLLFSAHDQKGREREAIETLLFMSSPGTTVGLKRSETYSPESAVHHHQRTAPHPAPAPAPATAPAPTHGPPPPASSQPSPARRQPLPDSAPARRPLPSHKPSSHSRSNSIPHGKRVGFERSPSSRTEMDVDSPTARQQLQQHPLHHLAVPSSKKRPNGAAGHGQVGGSGAYAYGNGLERRMFALPAALGAGRAPRAKPTDEEIEMMLDRAGAAVDSDDEDDGPIEMPDRVSLMAKAVR